MESDAAVQPGQVARTGAQPAAPSPAADVAVSALYQAHALGLIRLAYVMLGDTAAAEDVVQEAFTGLYRRWAQLSDPAKALPYVRSSVLNACRSQLRHLSQRPPGVELARIPRHYVVLTDTGPTHGWPRQAEVRATRTGRTVATLAAPRPDDAFIMAAAASGVGRYVLAAEPMTLEHEKVVRPDGRPVPGKTVGLLAPTGPVRFYQLRISSSGQVSALSPLPVPALPAGAVLDGLALTPDGRQLAVATRPGPEIQVDTLATGAQRVWTWPGAQLVIESQGGTGSALSWAADDRTLAFSQLIDGRYRVRLLDTTAPGSSLAASRPALTLNWSGSDRRFSHGRAVNTNDTFGALLTPDGSKIVVATVTQSKHPLTSEFAFTEFSVRTGKVVAVLGRWWFIRHWPQQQQAVLWTNTDGSTLLVLAHRPGVTVSPTSPGPGSVPEAFGVLHGNRYTPLPGAHRLDRLSVFPAW